MSPDNGGLRRAGKFAVFGAVCLGLAGCGGAQHHPPTLTKAEMRAFARAVNIRQADVPGLIGYRREEEAHANPESLFRCDDELPAALGKILSERFESEGREPKPKTRPFEAVFSTITFLRSAAEARRSVVLERGSRYLACVARFSKERGPRGALVRRSVAAKPLVIDSFSGFRLTAATINLSANTASPTERFPAVVTDSLGLASGPTTISLIFTHEQVRSATSNERRLIKVLQHRAAITRLP